LALPPNNASTRNVYLQQQLDRVEAHVALSEWPKLTKDDQFRIGRLVMIYNFVEFNLRRMLEAWEEAGLLTGAIKGRGKDLRIGAVEKTVQEMMPWPEAELKGLKRLAEIRNLRNLVAHFAVKRFPDDDAFLFIAKSEADFKKQFPGMVSDSNVLMTAILDGPVLPGCLDELENLQIWLAKQTSITVHQAHEIKTARDIPTPG
jgi:hypothetical protein